jgi:predicted transcriptional regulator
LKKNKKEMNIQDRLRSVQELKNLQEELKNVQTEKQLRQAQLEPLQERCREDVDRDGYNQGTDGKP